MKMKSFLAALAFILAIGSAVASEKFLNQQAYSSKDDVPSQEEQCEPREFCASTGSDCLVQVGGIDVPGYDAAPGPGCGEVLGMP